MLKKILQHTGRPKLFERGNTIFWDDPHTSKHLLDAHLDPSWDAASRRPETIDRTVAWIDEKFTQGNSCDILDLGCGPGLYAERLAELGHRVTAIDFSKRSIEYAKESNRVKLLPIEYIYRNYLEIEYENQFDLVILVYCDFGALTAAERDNLLVRVRRALKPGGTFVFDVFLEDHLAEMKEKRYWEAEEDGFWAAGRALALTETFCYRESKVALNQTVVLKEDGEVDVHRIYFQHYNEADITELLGDFDFVMVQGYRGLIQGHNSVLEPVLFVSARKS